MARTHLQKLHKAVQDQLDAEARERKNHDRMLYAIGRAHEEAGLFDLDETTRKGMLAFCTAELPKMREKWHAIGVKASMAPQEETRTPARATFPASATLSKQARAALAAEGLKEIRKLDVKLGYGIAEDEQLWSGHVVDYERAREVVAALGGALQRLGNTAPALREAAE